MKTIITGGTIIAFDGSKHVIIERGDVVFEDSQIIHAGQRYNGEVDRIIEAESKLVMPGLINIHTHSLSSPLLYRGILEDKANVLYKYLLPIRYGTTSTASYAKGQDAFNLSRVTLLETLKSGVTTVFEQTDNLEDAIRIAQTLGTRFYGCHSYYNGMPFEEKGSVVYPPFKESCPDFEENLRLIKEYHNTSDGRIKVWLGPHAPDTCTKELLQETRRKATELKVGIGTHVSQSLTEVNEIKKKWQKTPVEYLDYLGVLGGDVIAAHAIYTTDSDVAIIKRTGMTVAHCSSSYVKNGIRAPMAIYRRQGINVVLGTDVSCMDLLGEMRLAMFSSKLNEENPYATNALDVFNAVTLNASRALRRDDLGRIAPGAKADLVLVNLRQAHLSPFRDPIVMFLYHANRNDVDTVIVDGKICMSGREVNTVDEAEVVSQANESAHKIWRKLDEEIGLPEMLMDRVERV